MFARLIQLMKKMFGTFFAALLGHMETPERLLESTHNAVQAELTRTREELSVAMTKQKSLEEKLGQPCNPKETEPVKRQLAEVKEKINRLKERLSNLEELSR